MGGRDKTAFCGGCLGRGSRVARGKGRTRLVGAARGVYGRVWAGGQVWLSGRVGAEAVFVISRFAEARPSNVLSVAWLDGLRNGQKTARVVKHTVSHKLSQKHHVRRLSSRRLTRLTFTRVLVSRSDFRRFHHMGFTIRSFTSLSFTR